MAVEPVVSTSRTRSRRVIFPALFAAALVAGSGVSAADPSGPTVPKLRPDLVVLEPTQLSIQTSAGVKVLRFATVVGNRGRGVVELYPVEDDCDNNGDATDDRSAHQRVFEDTNGNGVYDPGADQVASETFVGCMIFHPQHNHWHFEDFARYRLTRRSTGRWVATARKVSFCVRDSIRAFPAVPGSPPDIAYGNCTAGSTMGMSVGWADYYGPTLAGQELDIGGRPDGRYCLALTADPSDHLNESREGNNLTETLLRIRGTRVRALDEPCWL